MSAEAEAAAKDALAAAITEFYAIVQPEVYVDGWVLVTHKLSTEMEQEGVSAVGTLPATGQSFVVTRGLLDAALTFERRSIE